MRENPGSTRLPSLDGWRAVSIIMVYGSHSALVSPSPANGLYEDFFDGILGVKFFFVISGFLITWLLLQEEAHFGRINLAHFYARRSLRILPAYFMFVGVLFALQCCSPFQETRAAWWGLLTFTRNFVVPEHGSIVSGPFWSLGVEEQFYLVWPALLVFLIKRGWRCKLIVLAIPILLAPLFRVGHYLFYAEHQNYFRGMANFHFHPAWLENLFLNASFFCVFDALTFGCLGAVLLAHDRARVDGFLAAHRRWVFVAGGLLVLVPHLLDRLPPGEFGGLAQDRFIRGVLPVIGPTFQELGFLLLLLQSLGQRDWFLYRVLNWRWFAWIGVISYSLYIWQGPICFRGWNGAEYWRSHPDAFWAWFWPAPAFAAAILSYYGLERPLFRLRARFRHE